MICMVSFGFCMIDISILMLLKITNLKKLRKIPRSLHADYTHYRYLFVLLSSCLFLKLLLCVLIGSPVECGSEGL